MKRFQYEGDLVVYRESNQVEHLSASVTTREHKVFYYYRCPKCFDDLITNGLDNLKRITFTADTNGNNPRAAKLKVG